MHLGLLFRKRRVNLFSQISGQVLASHFREGQMVRQGDPLIDLDARLYQARIATTIKRISCRTICPSRKWTARTWPEI